MGLHRMGWGGVGCGGAGWNGAAWDGMGRRGMGLSLFVAHGTTAFWWRRTHASARATSSSISSNVALPRAARAQAGHSRAAVHAAVQILASTAAPNERRVASPAREARPLSTATTETTPEWTAGNAPRWRIHTHTTPSRATVRGPDEFHHEVPAYTNDL